MRSLSLPNGSAMPVLGQGTWHMGEDASRRKDEVAALRLGIELGLTLIDTAEMYGEGGAETMLGEAIRGRRDGLFIVSKVYPHNASRQGVMQACERSLKRLGIDRLDLYLLHWRGSHPLAETVAGFEALRRAGKIAEWGVSNFDTDDMQELWATPGGQACVANQVLYNLARRGIEYDLLPWCREHGVAVMAYTPLEPNRLARAKALTDLARRLEVPPLALALAWVIRAPGIATIPKASAVAHVRANRLALDLALDAAALVELDRIFPPPKARRRLEML